MRLTEIKLAGFKSFVDPTTVTLRGNRNAVVGPNGCGKSNVIDAVRWVMGESSARQLRGEALTDVIFNGSSSRAATALASIELVFDNRDGRVGGQLSDYSEISIRREVSRDAQSTYYLNGTKCRRRDIADVFLGTGFGPRTYSIIEQGMISQLVEAKPEDLRYYLEEAAGISRYRERRRETQNRIQHTVDNLARLSDIREELDRQLGQLERQAKAAARYRTLKEDERRRTAELVAIQLKAVEGEHATQDDLARSLAVTLEKAASERQGLDTTLERARTTLAEGNDDVVVAQGRYHQLGADAAKLEQAIRFNAERIGQLKEDLDALAAQRQDAERQFDADASRISALRDELATSEPELNASEAVAADAARAEEGHRTEMQTADRAWEAFGVRRADNDRDVEVCRQRVDYGDRALTRLRERLRQLGQEAADIPESDLDDLARCVAQARERLDALDREVDANGQAMAKAVDASAACDRAAQAAEGELQTQRRELAALRAAQEVALGKDPSGSGSAVVEWLAEHDLGSAPRLGEVLTVEPGWERAVETVLGDAVQALLVEADAPLAASIEPLADARLTLRGAPRDTATDGPLAALQDHVDGSCGSLLAGVFAAPTVAVALRHRGQLSAGQSIVTQTGVWLGADWLRVDKGAPDGNSVLQRGRALDVMRRRVDEASARFAEARRRLTQAQGKVADLSGERERLQRERADAVAAEARAQSEHDVSRVRIDEAEARERRNAAEQTRLVGEIEEQERTLGATRAQLGQLVEKQAALAEEERGLRAERERLDGRLEAARVRARQARDAHERARLAHRSLQATLEAAEAGRERLLRTRRDLEARADQLLAALADVEAEGPLKQQALENKLADRVAVESALLDLRRKLDRVGSQIRELTTKRAAADAHFESVRADLETARVECARLVTKRDNLRAQLATTGFALPEALDGVPEDADEATWIGLLEALQRRIARLGQINLAAIDQYRQESERKAYLDRQHADLEAALTTLRGAIRRIDTDTRKRFKTTFDAVNGHLKVLFPRVFGGGHAYLELTGEDLLDTGVTLMARPPGKRNTSIHLLSGGEKAMAAVALIFAIFQLNPSPVCLLDEVDAPLDDTNVARFAELIRDMSADVQFVVITHNKQTIEMADHLLGVTMQEAGVSRLVSVDVESATHMVAAG
ncbi:MAG: chromosome segregation protein SMC [Gammaproteobacteria bacterium]|nr:chromosome segregation protein SMC [Gammaproteobacteria bacterium]